MISLLWGMYEVPEQKLFLVIMSLRNLFTFFVAISLKFKEYNWYMKFIQKKPEMLSAIFNEN